MNIIEATRKALKEGVGIKNKNDITQNYLLPTNTRECYIVDAAGLTATQNPIGFAVGNNTKAVPRWNPKAEDILSNDWELYPHKTV